MKNVTLQEVFDRVVKHLLTQNKVSFASKNGDSKNGDICAYRGAGGLMCAVGCLIPDNLYKPEMDHPDTVVHMGYISSTDIMGIVEHFGLNELFDFTVTDCSADQFIMHLATLQHIHDKTPTKMWEFELKEFAKKNNLEFCVL